MNIYDLIIIGGGPAGITAGIYAARQKLNTLLITKSFGGQVNRKAVAIENYPGFEKISGSDLITKFEQQLRKTGIEIRRDAVVKVSWLKQEFLVETKTKNQFKSKAVIVASGADPRPLEVPGEKEFIGKGVSYCTACDAPLYRDKTVAVIGGGNSGFEAAIALANWAKHIYILEFLSQVSADEINQELVQKTGKVDVITNAKVVEIKGDEFVNSIVYQDRETGQSNSLSLDGVFIEIGSQPATSFVKDLVDFNSRDEIKIDPFTNQAKTPGLFAAGDVTEVKYKQIVIACSEGAKAALSADKYIKKLLS